MSLVSETYQIWVYSKKDVFITKIGFDEEKYSKSRKTSIKNKKVRNIIKDVSINNAFISSKINFNLNEMEEYIGSIPELSHLNLNEIRADSDEYMGDAIYCLRFKV
jgi:cytoplasmic iron level regulating protein YaaA (DUF328/UPF0246 family)